MNRRQAKKQFKKKWHVNKLILPKESPRLNELIYSMLMEKFAETLEHAIIFGDSNDLSQKY